MGKGWGMGRTVNVFSCPYQFNERSLMMKKTFSIPFVCCIVFFFVACGLGFAAETTKKLPLKDPKILRQPLKRLPETTDQQQQQQPALQNPEVVSIEILPPMADCKPRWKVTVKNPNSVPFDKTVTIHIIQRLNTGDGKTAAYSPGDGVIAPKPIPANQTGTATGELMGDVMGTGSYLKNYSIEVQIEGMGQSIGHKYGQVPIYDQDVTISDCRMADDKCYVTFSNQKSYQACFLYLGSDYGQGPAPAEWNQGIAFRGDIPPNGSMERSFPRRSGFDTIKIKVKLGSKDIAERTMPFP
ncbi:MAG: hypothetical protein A4E64_00534 [Syntrophorhabdus sp. PtaU1.Bin058]|nr:MAG: hypothetical protein A4E64_00534 [Syntrophorhabdus sp. PtaU1.Bin058]